MLSLKQKIKICAEVLFVCAALSVLATLAVALLVMV
jgi:hypothetical protein